MKRKSDSQTNKDSQHEDIKEDPYERFDRASVTDSPPPFEVSDFFYEIPERPERKKGIGKIPCVHRLRHSPDAHEYLYAIIRNHFQTRSEIDYQAHLNFWDKAQLTNEGILITYRPERIRRYNALSKDYASKVKPLKILISGETGAGKSTLMTILASNLFSKILNFEEEAHNEVPYKTFLDNSLPKFDAGENIRQPKIAFFDAFEKLKPGATRQEIREQVKTIEDSTKHIHCIIISARSNFLINYVDEGFSDYNIIELSALDPMVVHDLALSVGDNDNFADIIRRTNTIGELCTKPLLFSMLADLYLEGINLTSIKSRLDVFSLIVDRWLVRDEDASLLRSSTRFLITKRLAVLCLGEGKNCFSYHDIDSVLITQFNEIDPSTVERFNSDIRNCGFIRRRESGAFEFQHASLLEYCIGP